MRLLIMYVLTVLTVSKILGVVHAEPAGQQSYRFMSRQLQLVIEELQIFINLADDVKWV